MPRLIALFETINRVTGRAVRWLALVMVLVQFVIVIGRYVYGVNSIAVQESVLYMHAALFTLGAGYTLLLDGHVRVDIFHARARPAWQRRIDVFGHVVFLLPAMLAILWWSWPTVASSWAILEGPISVGGIPALFVMKSLIPAFCVLLILQSLAALCRLLAAGRE